MTRILVDMDEVIASFLGGLDAHLDNMGSLADGIRRKHEHTQWDLLQGYSEPQKVLLKKIMATPGLFASLPPIPGALAALHEMDHDGHDIHIVTSPMSSNWSCASEKLEWVSRYLGDRWRQRVIITDDKTVIRGDFLFDDKPDITGSMEPEWQQILIDQPYNQTLSKALPRIASLADWRTAIKEVLA